MSTRERLEEVEKQSLAPYACLSSESRGRKYEEEEHPDYTSFQRDRGRIVHASAFRRLEYKTQVFVYHEGDHYRNRLTHSLEVAQIGRTLARLLRVNEDLVEVIALAHDLGHPPFGHSGERVLNEVMDEHGGFEHNWQSLRVVEIIEHPYPGFRGLNLSWELREGLAKHSTDYDSPEGEDYGPDPLPSIEAQLVCLADEIAYTGHDLDDGLNSGLLSFRALKEVALWEENYREAEKAIPGGTSRLRCHYAIRQIVNLLVDDCVRSTENAIGELKIASPADARQASRMAAGFSEDVGGRFGELKAFLRENLYQQYRVRRMAVKAEKILTEIFAIYTADHSLLPTTLRVHLEKQPPERIICDYLAGMTDRFAIREYRKLFYPLESI